MQRTWVSCEAKKPDSERLVLIARPDRDVAEPGHWFDPEQAWVTTDHVQVYPTMWRDMPAHPFAANN